MGIYPSSVSALELPYGVEESSNIDVEVEEGNMLNTTSCADEAQNEIDLLRTGAYLSDSLNHTQILRLCEQSLHSMLTKASRSSTIALSQNETMAGEAADSVISQLSDEGKQALCALILKRRLNTLLSLEDALSKKSTTDEKENQNNETLRTAKKRDRGVALESLFSDVAPSAPHLGSSRTVGSPGGSGVIIGRRGGQGHTATRRMGGRGT
jgi:hypothetical protein